MAGIPGIEALAAAPPPPRERTSERAPVEFGAAVTHRDAVRENARVDPAARSDRTRAAEAVRSGEQRRERKRGGNAYDGRRTDTGLLVDVSV